jgi:conjugal transfer pilus assembly protein TrbC
MARALKAQPLPTPERLTTQPPRAITPHRARCSHTPAAGSIDIAAMARQGTALTTPPPAATGTSVLRIFITLDMPRGSLQRLVDQAARSGATLVLRGLKAQSMRQTLAAVGELIETRRVSWVIDPDAFTRFQVSAAPTFVLTLADEPMPGTPGFGSVPELPRCAGTGCAALDSSKPTYLSVSGDVSLDYALDAMLRASPEATPRASTILQRLRKS